MRPIGTFSLGESFRASGVLPLMSHPFQFIMVSLFNPDHKPKFYFQPISLYFYSFPFIFFFVLLCTIKYARHHACTFWVTHNLAHYLSYKDVCSRYLFPCQTLCEGYEGGTRAFTALCETSTQHVVIKHTGVIMAALPTQWVSLLVIYNLSSLARVIFFCIEQNWSFTGSPVDQ